jgi:PEP-CTERM motif
MKKLILTAVLSVASAAAFGQGTIDLANIAKGTFVQPIFQPNPFPSNTVETVGSPSAAAYSGVSPAGTTVFGGAPVTTAYDMVLLYSTASVGSPSLMSAATILPFRSAATATASPSGGVVTVPTIPIPGTTGGTLINFAIGAFLVDPTVAAWEAGNTGYSAAALWAEALADFTAADQASQLGYSAIVTGIALGGEDTTGGPHAEPTTEEGWTSFSLVGQSVPEPSTLALAGLGAAGLLLFRRRK